MYLEIRQEMMEALQPTRSINENGIKVTIVIAVFWAIATISVGLRFYARHIKGGLYVLEDWLIVGALIMFFGFGTGNLLSVCIGGSGWHVGQLNPTQLSTGLKILLANQILYAVGLGLIKCSIVVLIIRVFTVQGGPFKFSCYVVLVLCIAWSIATILVAFVLCRPLGYNWNLLPVEGHCGNQTAAYTAIGVTDIITDVMIILLPQPVIWKLRLPTASRIALAGLLCLGLFTIGMSIARVVTILNTDFLDFTANTYNVIWPVVEFGVAIFVSCGPLLRPLFGNIAAFRTGAGSKSSGRLGRSSMKRSNGYAGFSNLTEDGTQLHSIAVTTTSTVSHNHAVEPDRNVPAQGITVERAWNFA